MKRIPLFILIVICFFWLGGCMEPITVTTGTLTTLPVDPVVRPMPLTAELKVSEQRARGEAEGLAVEQERLVREATALALGQDPPSIDGPDVLVGMNVFTAQTGDYMRVTVTGYPARYANFHSAEEKESACLNIIAPRYGGGIPPEPQGIPGLPQDVAAKPQLPEDVKKSSNFYFTLKYVTPLGIPVSLGAANAEFGWNYSNGMLFGIDLNFGLDNDGNTGGGIIGGGFNLGGVYKLPPAKMRIAYGGTVGFWFINEWEDYEYYDGDYYGYDRYSRRNFNLFAPFIKYRWKFFELSYRGLLGWYDGYGHGQNNDGFAWNNNQIMLGVYFGK